MILVKWLLVHGTRTKEHLSGHPVARMELVRFSFMKTPCVAAVAGIDDFGQVSGFDICAPNSGFLSTPSQPNSSGGTLSATSPLAGTYLNEFGQGASAQ